MKSAFFSLLFIVVLSVAVCGQQTTQKPAPTATPPAEGDVVKISTNLVQIDVTVTDSKGKIVTDLRPEEIEIYENGEKQKLSHFSFISSVRDVTEKPQKPKADASWLAPPPVPTILRPEQIRRTIALVVD